MSFPNSLVAGDLWGVRISDERFKEIEGYSARLIFALGNTRLEQPGSVGEAESEWVFVFPASQTVDAKPAGMWAWSFLVSRGDERYTAQSGVIDILPNPAETGPVEPKSIKRRTLEAAWETRLRLVSSEVSVAIFQGHAYTMLDIEKLDKIIRRLEDEVGGEGEGPGASRRKLVFSRFRKI